MEEEKLDRTEVLVKYLTNEEALAAVDRALADDTVYSVRYRP